MQMNPQAASVIEIPPSGGKQQLDDVWRYCSLRGTTLCVAGEVNNGVGGIGAGTVAKAVLHASDSLNERVTHSRYRSFQPAQPYDHAFPRASRAGQCRHRKSSIRSCARTSLFESDPRRMVRRAAELHAWSRADFTSARDRPRNLVLACSNTSLVTVTGRVLISARRNERMVACVGKVNANCSSKRPPRSAAASIPSG